jgi:Glycosyl transferase family 2
MKTESLQSVRFSVCSWNIVAALLAFLSLAYAQHDNNNGFDRSSFSRGTLAMTKQMTFPEDPFLTRKNYPADKPHICLAFLSCCGRTDLLNHTLAGAIRHMEEDEPSHLRYEIAWVDNGSGTEKTQQIMDSYQIEHALALDQNTGLAFGMNLLIFNLCQAPYILLLEEDWLYLDDIVAEQTAARKRAITTAIALTHTNITSFDLRKVSGVFLRPENYGFMTFPFADAWDTQQVDIRALPGDHDTQESEIVDVNYQIFCADQSIRSQYLWGSHTNGAGLYNRERMMDVGRMMGEPGDLFHYRYSEANYAYKAGLRHCHAAIQLGNCREVSNQECTAAFYHIGAGRGTQPIRVTNTQCASEMWSFHGSPMYEKMKRNMGTNFEEPCSREELIQFSESGQRELDSADYRKEVAALRVETLRKEEEDRARMREQAHLLRLTDPNVLRDQVEALRNMSDEDILKKADQLERFANSPHPVPGYYDSHGRPLSKDGKIANYS